MINDSPTQQLDLITRRLARIEHDLSALRRGTDRGVVYVRNPPLKSVGLGATVPEPTDLTRPSHQPKG